MITVRQIKHDKKILLITEEYIALALVLNYFFILRLAPLLNFKQMLLKIGFNEKQKENYLR